MNIEHVNRPLHFHEAMISLLMRREDWCRKLTEAMDCGARRALISGRPAEAFENTIRAICAPFEPTAKNMIRTALDQLRIRAGAQKKEGEVSFKGKMNADQVMMNWGKSELNDVGILTLRLIATHILMPADSVVIEHQWKIYDMV